MTALRAAGNWRRSPASGAAGKMEDRAGRLQQEALKRKERLRALRERQLQNQDQDEGEPVNKQLREDEDEEEVKHRELKLRNYVPEDKELKERQVPNAKPASVEDKVKDQLEAGKPEPVIEEVGPEKGCGKETGKIGEEDAESDSRTNPGETKRQ
ncbi:coiled-coil domain-containing protein 12 isoform X2 [Heptranchias perlo]|uniref:coiled-coil domain-containing protein 12 isoform X2 n=1 Tax=Heptranchias perlo TaxID=212740 RepID=UPI00355968AF